MFAYLCSCAGCGYSLPPIYYLCERCWSELAKECSPHRYLHLKWTAYTLWEWEQKQSLLHNLLQRRKGSTIFSAEERLAYLVCSALCNYKGGPFDEIFYPTKQLNKHDHTWYLAYAVGRVLGLKVTGIEVEPTERYKLLSRKERAQERLKNPRPYARYKGERPLLVDDIITTGATLEALWVALGRPEHTVSLCLAYKTFNSGDKI